MSGGFIEGHCCRLRHCSLKRRSAAMRSSRSCARVRLRRGIINPRPSPGSTASFFVANSPVGIPNWGKKILPPGSVVYVWPLGVVEVTVHR